MRMFESLAAGSPGTTENLLVLLFGSAKLATRY
jgi:hypothetical protein